MAKITKLTKKKNWLSGNFIPPEERKKYRIMFIGEKPARYFIKNPHLRHLGNYNATCNDIVFHYFLKKYKLGKIYVTDMVKTEGKPGADFIEEWKLNPIFKKCLSEEVKLINPKLIIFLSKKVEYLFNKEFNRLNIEKMRIYSPAFICKSNKCHEWDKQFEDILKYFKK